MAKTCNGCGADNQVDNQNVAVPYVVHESTIARIERHNKRLLIVILVLIGSVIGTNLAWLIYENSFEEVSTTEEIIVDADDNGNENHIGHDGNIYNGENNGKENNENP